MPATLPFGAPVLSQDWEISEIADWVELESATRGRFLRGTIQSGLARILPESAATVAEEVWAELERRSKLCADAWPLRLSGDTVRARVGHRNALWHYFLCTLSLGEDVSGHARRLFEYGVADVMRAITGQASIRIGSPRGPELPSSLDDAISAYVRLAHEVKTSLVFPTTDKDYGLDIASWRSFRDGRGAYLPFIGQCATGKDWYVDHKAFELQLDAWRPHVTWNVTPVRFFAVPFVIPPQHWFRAANAGGLVLDRPRLLELALASPIARPRRHSIHTYCVSLKLDEVA